MLYFIQASINSVAPQFLYPWFLSLEIETSRRNYFNSLSYVNNLSIQQVYFELNGSLKNRSVHPAYGKMLIERFLCICFTTFTIQT